MLTHVFIGGADRGVPTDVLAALRHDWRRTAVELLQEEGALSFVSLANRLAETTDRPLPNVIIELHDTHLPALIDAGLIDYDDERGRVTLAADPALVERALSQVRDETDT